MSGRVTTIGETPVVGASASALAIADFLARTEAERLRLFRQHLRATVRSVSPLLVDLAAMEQVDLTAISALMLPPTDWPWRPFPDRAMALVARGRARILGGARDGRRETQRFRRDFASPGLVVRDYDHPRGRFAVRPEGGVLGFVAAIGPCVLGAFGRTAMIRLPGPLPETILASMPGRRLGQLVDHPLFRDRDCVIARVLADEADPDPIVMFRVPLVSFAMDWADRLTTGSRS